MNFKIGTMSNNGNEKHDECLKEGWGTPSTRRTYRDLKNLDQTCDDLDEIETIGNACAKGEDSGNGEAWGQHADLELEAIAESISSMEIDS
mmetsp:Transcript_6527/g.9353  ORF Transcript_6527/g.9353 Transcript_6527/m.9353 type:complete len:91 (-) Transcript_6527:578-850(-)